MDCTQVNLLIDSLEDKKISFSYLERALELPFGTIQRWKEGDITPEEMTLLKIISVYPWIIQVADNQFNHKVANAVLVKEASKIICSKLLE